jgi:hypothetical protein
MQPRWETEGFQMLQSKEGAVIYAEKSATVVPQLPEGSYALRYIDPKSGRVTLLEKKLKVTDTYQLPVGRTGAYWLQRL